MRNRIKELRAAKGWSQDQLGDAIGVGWQTISRIENLRARLVPKRETALAEAFGVRPSDLYAPDDPKGVRRVRVQQHVQAGYYAESNYWPEDEGYEVVIPEDPFLSAYKLYGAEARGPSMNRIYPERTVIVFTNVIETGEEPIIGKRYIVERERADGLREATVKTLQRDERGRFWLVPESDDPSFAPIPLDDSPDTTIRIVGRVHYSVRRE